MSSGDGAPCTVPRKTGEGDRILSLRLGSDMHSIVHIQLSPYWTRVRISAHARERDCRTQDDVPATSWSNPIGERESSFCARDCTETRRTMIQKSLRDTLKATKTMSRCQHSRELSSMASSLRVTWKMPTCRPTRKSFGRACRPGFRFRVVHVANACSVASFPPIMHDVCACGFPEDQHRKCFLGSRVPCSFLIGVRDTFGSRTR